MLPDVVLSAPKNLELCRLSRRKRNPEHALLARHVADLGATANVLDVPRQRDELRISL